MSNLIDDELLQELKSLMEDEFSSLLDKFLSDSQEHYGQARDAWTQGDLAGVRLYAHSLRGSSGNLGAVELQNACASLEDFARNGQGKEVGEQLAVVQQHLNETADVLRGYL